jgi:hypothetical protein
MSHIPDDYDQFWSEFDNPPPALCELCGKAPMVDGFDYCAPCQAHVDRSELPMLEPIAVKPVELDAAKWAEWRAEADTADEHY